MRASDAERAVITQRLNLALNEGRLDLDEYDRRISAAYAAKTRADLAPLVSDLPAPVIDTSAAAVAERRAAARREWREEVRNWAGVSVILVAIWAVTSFASGGLIFFWPMFPIGIWGAVLVSQLITGEADKGKNKGKGKKHGHGNPHRQREVED
jgi:hypothetical protein